MNEPAASSSIDLFNAWDARSSDLSSDENSLKIISASIEQLRSNTHLVLAELD